MAGDLSVLVPAQSPGVALKHSLRSLLDGHSPWEALVPQWPPMGTGTRSPSLGHGLCSATLASPPPADFCSGDIDSFNFKSQIK